MCTAIIYQTNCFYFGRTLDYEFSFGEEVIVTPRNFPLTFRHSAPLEHHYAIIGMAHVANSYPLYYDAVNEKGLAMAGLNFVGNAVFQSPAPGMDNIAVFEFIPWILAQCGNIREAANLLSNIRLTGDAFSPELPAAQLHWILADSEGAITVEATDDGLQVYPNPVGVLTNNPPFPMQMFHLNQFMHLSAKDPVNHFSDRLPLQVCSRGMGALGLPGDLSSQSRFVRAAFTKLNSVSGSEESESVGQFFHILETVSQTMGCCELADGKYEKTIYTSCCNADKGVYYYTTYGNRQITAVDMHRTDLESRKLTRYPLVPEQQIRFQN